MLRPIRKMAHIPVTLHVCERDEHSEARVPERRLKKKGLLFCVLRFLVLFCKRRKEAKYMKTYFNSMKEAKASGRQGRLDKA